jgi:glycosyltransferase involved in cell wall biosynthesis
MENTNVPYVTCLTATYGRLSHLREAVSCFLAQDYPNKNLVILNNNPVPISCDLPGVKVINESGFQTLGMCRNRLIKEITGEYVNTWDDDDWWLSWHLSQAIEYIQKHNVKAWKPARSFGQNQTKGTWWYKGNAYEASMVVSSDLVREYGYKDDGMGDEHRPLLAGIKDKLRVDEVGIDRASYVYNWGNGLCHASGTLGSKKYTLEQRTKRWMDKHIDVEGELVPVDYSEIKKKINEGKKWISQNL